MTSPTHNPNNPKISVYAVHRPMNNRTGSNTTPRFITVIRVTQTVFNPTEPTTI